MKNKIKVPDVFLIKLYMYWNKFLLSFIFGVTVRKACKDFNLMYNLDNIIMKKVSNRNIKNKIRDKQKEILELKRFNLEV